MLPVTCYFSEMENVTFRWATLADKEEVLRISVGVFDGRDYLPAYYDHFLTSPDIYPAVMVNKNNEIVKEKDITLFLMLCCAVYRFLRI